MTAKGQTPTISQTASEPVCTAQFTTSSSEVLVSLVDFWWGSLVARACGPAVVEDTPEILPIGGRSFGLGSLAGQSHAPVATASS